MRLPGLWPFRRPERRDVQLPPALSVLAGSASAEAARVTPATALGLMAVWACVRVIAEDVASLPLITYRRRGRGRERATDHPLYRLLHDEPNPEIGSMQMREMMQAHLCLWGNAYAEIQVAGGRPVALWPVHPSRVTVRRDPSGIRYTIRLPDGASVVLGQERVLHVMGLSLDGLVGLSPISYARQALGLGLSTQEFAAAFFARGAAPSAVLEHPGTLSMEAHERLRADFERLHAGLSNMQRIAVLEEGMKLSKWGIPMEDAQFLEQRQFTVEEVCRLYRMQPHKIADLRRATFSNIEHQAIEHVVDTVRPWLVRWEQAINRSLLRPEEKGVLYVEHLVDGLLRGDIESRYRAYAIGRQWGWLSVNDVRALENMNPVDGGDEYLTPLNMVPAGAAAGGNSNGARDQVRYPATYNGDYGRGLGRSSG